MMLFDMRLTLPELVEQFGDYVVCYIPPGTTSTLPSTCVMMVL